MSSGSSRLSPPKAPVARIVASEVTLVEVQRLPVYGHWAAISRAENACGVKAPEGVALLQFVQDPRDCPLPQTVLLDRNEEEAQR